MPGASLVRLAHREQYLAAAVQRLGLAGLVTDLAEQRDRSLIVVGSPLGASVPQVDSAQVRQRLGLACPVAGLQGKPERMLEMAGRLVQEFLPLANAAEVGERAGLPGPIADLTEYR